MTDSFVLNVKLGLIDYNI